MLPQGGFPRQLMAASWLGWMLVLGSFVTWRDATLLFQAIPSIALFGLVGCYDTFRDVTFAFFGFLMCLATLFARAHSREMLRLAAESGYFNRGELPGRSQEELEPNDALMDRIKSGPWRWVAGPEWALASALVIVLLSLLGAPVLRESVQGVAGLVQVTQPQIRSNRPAFTTRTASSEDVAIGRGPNTTLSNAQLFAVRTEGPRYLRTMIMDTYTGRGWRSSLTPEMFSEGNVTSATIDQIKEPKEVGFELVPLRPTRVLPTPGEVLYWADTNLVRPRIEGVWQASSESVNTEYRGSSIISSDESKGTEAVKNLPPFLKGTQGTASVHPDVVRLAREASARGRTDIEKARLIKREIESRAKYNLNAQRTPDNQDPVRYFLFDGQEGYCDLFASSMVVMARSVGIPARYVQGYLPDPDTVDQQGRLIVVDKDYHAWAELFIKDVGWVIFDATEGALQVEGGERGAASDTTLWYQRDWFRRLLDGLMLCAVVVGGYFAYRFYLQSRPANPQKAQLDSAFVTYSRLLERASGRRRQISQTPDEFLEASRGALNGTYQSAKDLNRKFVRAMYSPEGVDDATVAEIRADLRNLQQMLKKEQPAGKA